MTHFSGNEHAIRLERRCQPDNIELSIALAQLHETRIANLIALAREQRISGYSAGPAGMLAEAEEMMAEGYEDE